MLLTNSFKNYNNVSMQNFKGSHISKQAAESNNDTQQEIDQQSPLFCIGRDLIKIKRASQGIERPPIQNNEDLHNAINHMNYPVMHLAKGIRTDRYISEPIEILQKINDFIPIDSPLVVSPMYSHKDILRYLRDNYGLVSRDFTFNRHELSQDQRQSCMLYNLPAQERSEKFGEIFKASKNINNEGDRGLVFEELAYNIRFLPEEERSEKFGEIFKASKNINNEGNRRLLLISLSRNIVDLPEEERSENFGKILDSSKNINNEGDRRLVLEELARQLFDLPVDRKPEYFNKIIEASNNIRHELDRVFIINNLTPRIRGFNDIDKTRAVDKIIESSMNLNFNYNCTSCLWLLDDLINDDPMMMFPDERQPVDYMNRITELYSRRPHNGLPYNMQDEFDKTETPNMVAGRRNTGEYYTFTHSIEG